MAENGGNLKVLEVAHWLVITALHDERLLQARREASAELRRNPVRLPNGLDEQTVAEVLALSKQLPDLFARVTAVDFKESSAAIESVLSRLLADDELRPAAEVFRANSLTGR